MADVSRPVLLQAKYRSRLELKVANQLSDAKIKHGYETTKVKYVVPARNAAYTPDFTVGNILIESKGYFHSTHERQKLVFARESNPGLDIRLVFQRSTTPIYKNSKTTYADWATSHGFKWADDGVIPDAWIAEMRANAKAQTA